MPALSRGLAQPDFTKTSENGFGDRNNAYAHSMAWFRGRLYVGTSRATLCLLRGGMPDVTLSTWPVPCEHKVYTPAFEEDAARAELWAFDPTDGQWQRVFQAPMVTGQDDTWMSRDIGYRSMVVFQGRSDSAPALYVSTWSRSLGEGFQILRSEDGATFEPVPGHGLVGLPATSTRSLVPFNGWLFTSPTGATKGRQNASGLALVYVSDDPASGHWTLANTPAFDDNTNLGIFEIAACGDWLYAGTGNIARGMQLWRTRAEGRPPFTWERVITDGGGRGRLNQGVVSMACHGGLLYAGTGIQKGGFDKANNIGPAGPELFRVYPDGHHEVVVGEPRDGTPALSGLMPGWNSFFAGSIWKMCSHDGWLYAGTQDWSVFLRFQNLDLLGRAGPTLLHRVGVDFLTEHFGGFDLWRSADGELWLPVSRNGFGNAYNHGLRTMCSTEDGLYIGTANQFGPDVAVRTSARSWAYRPNEAGGCEVWRGRHAGTV